MRSISYIGIAALVAFVATGAATPHIAQASHCGSPPKGGGYAWSKSYARWCSCMGGSYNQSTTRCSGATGGHGGTHNAPNSGLSARQRQALSLNRMALTFPNTLKGKRDALRLFNRACKLWSSPTICDNALFASKWVQNEYGIQLFRQGRYLKAIPYFRRAVSGCPQTTMARVRSCRVMAANLKTAVNAAHKKHITKKKKPWSKRWCRTCYHALRNDLNYGLKQSANVPQYVRQARAKYGNCSRRGPSRCRGTLGWNLNKDLKSCRPPSVSGGAYYKNIISAYKNCLRAVLLQH
jgi:hypothetical protein